jgi:hypothetical protein
MPAKGECSACSYEREHSITIDESVGASKWEAITGISRFSIRRHLAHDPVTDPADGVTESAEDESTGRKEWTLKRDRAITLEDARAWVRSSGDDPANWNVAVRSIAYGDGLWSNKVSAWPKVKKGQGGEIKATVDPIGILTALRKTSKKKSTALFAQPNPHATDSAFVLSINDIQLGQSYNGGSAATIEAYYDFVALAVERVRELRAIGRRLETLVIVGGGDLVEGCVIYPNQAFSLDLNRKQQIEGVVALLLHTIDTLAPMFESVKVIAAAGNHGQNRIAGNYTTLDDNDDTHSFEMVRLALSRDPAMSHIEWTIAESEAGVATHVYDWVLATTHGDVYAKGVQGATIDKKAHTWMKNMALGRERFGLLGQANVLIGHHFHHEKSSDWGSCLWKQTPSLDRGSPYFENATGEYSLPGMLTAVMTPTSRWQDEAILRPSPGVRIAA